jgi:hypothetical protein
MAHEDVIDLLHAKLVELVDLATACFLLSDVPASVEQDNHALRRDEGPGVALPHINLMDLQPSVRNLSERNTDCEREEENAESAVKKHPNLLELYATAFLRVTRGESLSGRVR